MKQLLALLAAAAAFCAITGPALGAGKTVRVDDDRFSAKTVRVTKGSTVTWRWVGDDDHNVAGRGFRSPTKDSGTFRRKFSKRGSFSYRCTLHGGMTGKVVVR